MSQVRASLLAAVVLLTALTPRLGYGASGTAPGWGGLDEWIGKYPSEPITKGARPLLELPELSAALAPLLSEPDRRKLKAFAVEQPVTRIAGMLVVNRCMPHDCGAENATVVIDTAQQRIWVGFFSRAARVVSVRWFGNTDPATIPPEVIAAFAARHQP